MSFSIEQCTSDRYEELLAVFNRSFVNGGTPDDPWFQKHMPHCVPFPADAAPSDIANHYYCLENGNILGGLGAYRFDWTVSDGVRQYAVKTFGIGQVCCTPEHRNRGVMSALMKAVCAEFDAQGYGVSHLTGSRFRYHHFGYDIGGNTVHYHLDPRKLIHLEQPGDFNMRLATTDDIPALDALYKTLPSYLSRDRHMWTKHIRRGLRYWIARAGDRQAYACLGSDNCPESAGDPELIFIILRNWMIENMKMRVNISLYYTPHVADGLTRLMYERADGMGIGSHGHIRIGNAEPLFDMLRPTVVSQTGRDGGELTAEQKEAVLRRLFGHVFRPLPGDIAAYAGVRPLCAWWPNTEDV